LKKTVLNASWEDVLLPDKTVFSVHKFMEQEVSGIAEKDTEHGEDFKK
jgi:hypothetical protein